MMKKLDMSGCRPFAKMGSSCRTREIKEKKIVWPAMEEKRISGDNFVLRGVNRVDVNKIARFWADSYPELYGSVHGWMLIPEEYETRVAFAENWKDDSKSKPHAVIVAEEIETGDLAMASLLTKFDQNLHVEASFFAIHPDFRTGKKGFDMMAEIPEYYNFLESSGAEYVTVFCETWHNITQYIWFKRFGWKIAGIFPGNMTRWSGEQQEYRGCTVYFYRFLNGGELYSTRPEEWQLLPEVKRLWDCLEEINQESDDMGLRKKKQF